MVMHKFWEEDHPVYNRDESTAEQTKPEAVSHAAKHDQSV